MPADRSLSDNQRQLAEAARLEAGFPSSASAATDLAEWQARSRAEASAVSSETERQSASRFELPIEQVLDGFSGYSKPWSDTLSLYIGAIPDAPRAWLWRVLQGAGVVGGQNSATLATRLKELSDIAKVHNVALSKHWMYAVNMELLGGYLADLKADALRDSLVEWVVTEAKVGPEQGYVDWLARFEEQCKNFFKFDNGSRAPRMTPAEFVADPALWATTGSSDIPSMLRGARAELSNTKWGNALTMSGDRLLAKMLEGGVDRNKAITKRELGKVRLIIVGSLSTYLKMSYLSHYLEASMRGDPKTTLFSRSPQDDARIAEGMRRARTGDGCFMPVDFSKFDNNVTADMRRVAINAIIDAAIMRSPPEARQIGELLRATFNRTGGVTVKLGETVYPANKGVLSGWRWTALLDTVVNYAMLRAAEMPGLQRLTVQGDDAQCWFDSEENAYRAFTKLRALRYPVNPHKNFVSSRVDEYLRFVTTSESYSGYPARAVPSLFFRKPWQPDDPPGFARAMSQFTNWTQCVARGLSWEKLRRNCVADIARGNHWSGQYAERFVAAREAGVAVAPDGPAVRSMDSTDLLTRALTTKGDERARWKRAPLPQRTQLEQASRVMPLDAAAAPATQRRLSGYGSAFRNNEAHRKLAGMLLQQLNPRATVGDMKKEFDNSIPNGLSISLNWASLQSLRNRASKDVAFKWWTGNLPAGVSAPAFVEAQVYAKASYLYSRWLPWLYSAIGGKLRSSSVTAVTTQLSALAEREVGSTTREMSSYLYSLSQSSTFMACWS